VKQLPITSGSDGHLYIWKDRAIIKKQHAHPKEAILCLYTTPNSNIFVSGATDGQIIIWHFGSSLIIQKIK
jgi:WD40 repeat protein